MDYPDPSLPSLTRTPTPARRQPKKELLESVNVIT